MTAMWGELIQTISSRCVDFGYGCEGGTCTVQPRLQDNCCHSYAQEGLQACVMCHSAHVCRLELVLFCCMV